MQKTLDEILNELKKFNFDASNDNSSFYTSHNAKYTGDYSQKSVKRTKLVNCAFDNAKFDYAAVTGSFFQECNFSQCSMDKADFEFCNFENCNFTNNPFRDESFNNSVFYDSKFFNSPFTSCTLTGVHFKKNFFSNSNITHCTLEGAVFEDCTLQNMDLSQLNMEYIELENVHMDNVVLPFSQIPYIFGGVDYIKNTSDNISLTGDGLYRITKEEYLSEGIKLLCDYYEIQECHFPLANIYLSLADISKAYEHLKLGMQQCVIMKDFRILKYFCKLAAKSDMFSYKQLSSMYTIIQKYLPVDSLNKEQMHNYSKHIGEIKTILFSKHNMPRMTFTIKTNIEPDNVQVLSKLLESIFLFKSKICNMGHTSQVILAQNSPFIVTVDVTDQLQNLCSFAMLLISLVSETDMLYQLYSDCIDSSNCIEKSKLKSISSSLLKIANEQNKYYREKKVILSVDEILFYNIKQNLKKNLQYFNPNRTQGFSLKGE